MKRLQVAHKTACGLAPGRLVGHAPQYLLFQSHPLTSGFSSLKLQAATGPLHVLCPSPGHLQLLTSLGDTSWGRFSALWTRHSTLPHPGMAAAAKSLQGHGFCLPAI